MFILNPRLAADIFDGEYIIANLDTGLYYSVQGIAVPLLQSLPFDNVDAVIQSFLAALPEDASAIQSELPAVFQQLRDEGVVLQADATATIASGAVSLPSGYQTPRFNRYADMQDLLMLDPIHDVDEEGWSVRKEA